jgi:DNA-binding MurR/RpiR family transcriptional regulator
MTQRRYTRETLRLTEFAKEAGAAIISIVDSPLAPTAAISDVTLVGHAASKSLISSAVATVAVSQLLVSLLVGAMGERTTAMFRKAQHQLDWFDSLESD